MTAVEDDDFDDRNRIRRKCFVIMPFGLKLDAEALKAATLNSPSAEKSTVLVLPGAEIAMLDFDSVFDNLIAPALKKAAEKVNLEISCERADRVSRSGFIHRDMLDCVVNSDVAIVDITTQSANVFYELGVRHALRRSTTILIQRQGTHVPFNIAGMRVFSYDDSPLPQADGMPSPLALSIERLCEVIAASFRQKENDSLVHNLLPNISVIRESWPIMERHYIWFDVLRDGRPLTFKNPAGRAVTRSVGYITGDILDVKDVDVWINPENTKMQLARFHDGSVSSNIRYFGGRRDERGFVVQDLIADSLNQRMNGAVGVEPGVVVATAPGMLADRNKVKLLLHVAALQGEPGKGYQPIRDYPRCVLRALEEVDRLNALPASQRSFWRRSKQTNGEGELQGLQCSSVLFPLFGTRSFGQHPQTVAEKLYRAAVVFLEQHPSSQIDSVYFLAFTHQDRELCDRALGLLESENRLAFAERSRGAPGPKDETLG